MKNGFFISAILLTLSFTTACHQKMKARAMPGAKLKVTYTMVVRNENLLPNCDAGTEGLSAYISESDSFLKCYGHSWQGAKPGDSSGRFQARAPVRYNEWYDRKSNRQWAAPIREELTFASIKPNVCHQGWQLPTAEELRTASSNGLFDGLKAHGGISFDKAWTMDLKPVSGISRGEWETIELRDVENIDKESAGVYCIRPA